MHKIIELIRFSTRYQKENNLPIEDMFELRSKASFLLVHGDLSFETIRPIIPKIVYIGGVQCEEAKPLQGELKTFLDNISKNVLPYGTIHLRRRKKIGKN